QGHRAPVCALQADEHRLVSAAVDGVVVVWDLGTGEELFQIDGHTPAIRSLQFNQQYLVTDGTSGCLILHDFSG
ncbi:unnamed protein product, partial [Discosporangium mesarthrocarpum]